MNAHMEDLDRYTDYKCFLVLDLCHEQNLMVVNRENKCYGQVTWQCVNRQPCIDYALVSETVYERVDRMMIGELEKIARVAIITL